MKLNTIVALCIITTCAKAAPIEEDDRWDIGESSLSGDWQRMAIAYLEKPRFAVCNATWCNPDDPTYPGSHCCGDYCCLVKGGECCDPPSEICCMPGHVCRGHFGGCFLPHEALFHDAMSALGLKKRPS